ncbi:MAG TPA: diheme cytochrome c [Roseateles sp.]
MRFTLTSARWMLLLTLAPALVAQAGDHGATARVTWPKAYVQECAACHVAYPPGMLPAASWARLMGGLDRHFGTDASLDPQDVQRLGQWLQDNAARRRATEAPPQDRITRTPWFERKHRHIEAATWRLPSVRSAANCMACHTGADQGRYSEHALRMPEGLSARQRAAWDD